MKLREKNPALLLIDIQKGMLEEKYWGGNRNNEDAEEKARKLLNTWRKLNLPILHIQHSSQNPQSKLHASHPGFTLQEIVQPLAEEPVIIKRVNSAFIGTDLKERLDAANITTLVVVGLTTNHCVSTTVRMAGNFGYEVLLVSDATATFDRVGINGEKFSAELIHQTTLASLHEEFAEVVSMEEVLKKI